MLSDDMGGNWSKSSSVYKTLMRSVYFAKSGFVAVSKRCSFRADTFSIRNACCPDCAMELFRIARWTATLWIPPLSIVFLCSCGVHLIVDNNYHALSDAERDAVDEELQKLKTFQR